MEPANATAAAYPRWVLLNWYGTRQGDAFVPGDGRTVADSCTSTGWPFRVSLGLAPPPASSSLNHSWLGAGPPGGDKNHRPTVVAAHGGCVLFELRTPQPRDHLFSNLDYFLYDPGAAAAARLPSLALLPACYVPMQYERGGGGGEFRTRPRLLEEKDTVVFRRRGDGALLVAQLEVSVAREPVAAFDDGGDEPKVSKYETRIKAELCVLRPGRGEWRWELVEAVPVVHGEPAGSISGGRCAAELMRDWETDVAVAVGDRFLCFVDYLRGLLLCDAAAAAAAAMAGAPAESPVNLRYVPLPVVPPGNVRRGGRRGQTRRTRNLSADAGPGAVRFVKIDTRCCGGGAGRTSCARGRFAFTVTTWTLSLTTAAAGGELSSESWVKDGVLDCEELWAFLPRYEGLPRVRLEFPIVSSDNPDIVYFTVCEDNYGVCTKKKVWMVEVDTRRKELLSVSPCTIDPWRAESHVAVKLK